MAPKTEPEHPLFTACSVPQFLEMGAYEALWSKRGTTFKTLSEMPDGLVMVREESSEKYMVIEEVSNYYDR